MKSVSPPFARRAVAGLAAHSLTRAGAMGLLGEMKIDQLDMPTLRRVVGRTAEVGIGKDIQLELQGSPDPDELMALLSRWGAALEESPVPEFEWGALESRFGTEQLASLLHISVASVRRYAAQQRPTPDLVADRLHFLATVVGDLAGAYNDYGIRRWFHRPRSVLGGKTPAQLLAKGWDPDGEPARRVRELARSLGSSSAT